MSALAIGASRDQSAKLKRLLSVAVPASFVTVGLFSAMQALVHVDDFSAPALKVYDVEPIMVQEKPKDDIDPTRKPVRPTEVLAPPANPKFIKTDIDPSVPDYRYTGGVPDDFGRADFDGLKPKRVTSMTIRRLQPLTPPVPTYPTRAERLGLEGDCDVFFSVSTRGEPFDIQAQCSDRVFKPAAEKSIKRVKFAPKIHNGLPVTVTGVVYPLEFRIKP